MGYVAKLSVSFRRDRLVEGRVRSAIRHAGGIIERVERRRVSLGGEEITYLIQLDQAQLMHGVVKNVEAVEGAAIVDAGAPMLCSDDRSPNGRSSA